MEPIFDKNGLPVGWLQETTVFSLNGEPKAFLVDNAIPSYSSVHSYSAALKGYFSSGFFRDFDGNAVGFIDGAPDAPLLPSKQMASVPPMPQMEPVRPLATIPPMPRIPSLSWSNLPWDDFI